MFEIVERIGELRKLESPEHWRVEQLGVEKLREMRNWRVGKFGDLIKLES